MTPNLATIYAILALSCLAIGLTTLIHKHRSIARTNFGILALSQSFWIISLFLGYYFTTIENNLQIAIPAIRYAYFFGMLLTPALIYFLHDFSQTPTKPKAITKFFLYPATLILGILTVTTPLIYTSPIVENQVYKGDILGPLYPLYLSLVTFHIIYGLYLSIKKLLSAKDLKLIRFTIITSATWVFLLPAFLINVVLPFFQIYPIPFQTVILSMFFTAPTFFAIIKYRFFSPTYLATKIANFLIFLITFVLFFLNFQFFSTGLLSAILAFSATIFSRNFIPQIPNKKLANTKERLLNLSFQIEHLKHPAHLKQVLIETLNLELQLPQAHITLITKRENTPDFPCISPTQFSKKIKPKIYLKHELPEIAHYLSASVLIPLFIEDEPVAILHFDQIKNFYFPQEILNLLQILKTPLQNYLAKYLVTRNLSNKEEFLKNLVEKHTSRLTDFIALTAHELRTPLSIALFQLEDSKYSHASNKAIMEDLLVIENSLEHLKSLTDKLFDIQRFDLNRIILHKKKQDVVPILHDLVDDFNFSLKNKGKKLTTSIPSKKIICEFDKSLIRQVFHNILNNAARFGDQISIKLQIENKHAKISICDNGPGISDNDKIRLFNKFQTTDHISSQGLGLGLYICKKIIDLHFGIINISDNSPKGTCLNIYLPL